MKKNKTIWINQLLIIGLTAILIIGCEKDHTIPSSNNLTNGKTTAIFNNSKIYGTMTDQDGNVYKTITIGTQTWMAENLRTTKYRDGSAISEITENETWNNLTIGAYCNYNNAINVVDIATYGRLYNWNAVSESRNLAPAGWHIPTDSEWTQLSDYLGGESETGGKLKEIGTTHWQTPNHAATNETGFTALPSGVRQSIGAFYNIGLSGAWWSATEDGLGDYWIRGIYYLYSGLARTIANSEVGISVRCVKD